LVLPGEKRTGNNDEPLYAPQNARNDANSVLMLLEIREQLNANASPEEVWKLLRDTPRLAALLPGVEEVSPLNDPEAESYSARAMDKIGPFKVALKLEIRIQEAQEASHLTASIKGADAIGLNRITGLLHIMLSPAPPATQMQFEANIEILGKLATLGAAPIRRRTTEKFAEFARKIRAQFAAEPGAAGNSRPPSATGLRPSSRIPPNRSRSRKDRR
jgi:carbon monoxide dehydrogenase subunit G